MKREDGKSKKLVSIVMTVIMISSVISGIIPSLAADTSTPTIQYTYGSTEKVTLIFSEPIADTDGNSYNTSSALSINEFGYAGANISGVSVDYSGRIVILTLDEDPISGDKVNTTVSDDALNVYSSGDKSISNIYTTPLNITKAETKKYLTAQDSIYVYFNASISSSSVSKKDFSIEGYNISSVTTYSTYVRLNLDRLLNSTSERPNVTFCGDISRDVPSTSGIHANDEYYVNYLIEHSANKLNQTITLTPDDKLPPRPISAITTSATNITMGFSEDLEGTTVELQNFKVSGYYGDFPIRSVEVNGGTVNLTLYEQLDTDATPTIYIYAGIEDLNGNAMSGTKTITASDGAAPIITNIQVLDITKNSAKITWDTSEAADSLVKYGMASESYIMQKKDSAYVTSHEIELTGLSANTTYYFVVNSTDVNNNSAQSAENSFVAERVFAIHLNEDELMINQSTKVIVTTDETGIGKTVNLSISSDSPLDSLENTSLVIDADCKATTTLTVKSAPGDVPYNGTITAEILGITKNATYTVDKLYLDVTVTDKVLTKGMGTLSKVNIENPTDQAVDDIMVYFTVSSPDSTQDMLANWEPLAVLPGHTTVTPYTVKYDIQGREIYVKIEDSSGTILMEAGPFATGEKATQTPFTFLAKIKYLSDTQTEDDDELVDLITLTQPDKKPVVNITDITVIAPNGDEYTNLLAYPWDEVKYNVTLKNPSTRGNITYTVKIDDPANHISEDIEIAADTTITKTLTIKSGLTEGYNEILVWVSSGAAEVIIGRGFDVVMPHANFTIENVDGTGETGTHINATRGDRIRVTYQINNTGNYDLGDDVGEPSGNLLFRVVSSDGAVINLDQNMLLIDKGLTTIQKTYTVPTTGELGIYKVKAGFGIGTYVASGALDMAFVIDTSGSMNNEWTMLDTLIENFTQSIWDSGVDLNVTIYNLASLKSTSPYAKLMNTVTYNGVNKSAHSEDWGPGTTWAALYHPWRSGAGRVIIPISDECAYAGGTSEGSDDIASIQEAITACTQNDVTVYPFWGDGSSSSVISEMNTLANGTGGDAYYFLNTSQVSFALGEIVTAETVGEGAFEVDVDEVTVSDLDINPNPAGLEENVTVSFNVTRVGPVFENEFGNEIWFEPSVVVPLPTGDLETVTEDLFIDSPHPYPSDYDETWEITKPGAEQIRVHFDHLETAESGDKVRIYDGDDNLITTYTYNWGSTWTPWVTGDTIKVRLTSDYDSNTDYGFSIDSIQFRRHELIPHEYNGDMVSIAPGDTENVNVTIPGLNYTGTYDVTAFVDVYLKEPGWWLRNKTDWYMPYSVGPDVHGDDYLYGDFEVKEPARIIVTDLEVSGLVNGGELFTANVTVENIGGLSGNDTVEVNMTDMDGTVIATNTTDIIALNADACTYVTLQFTAPTEEGRYAVIAQTRDTEEPTPDDDEIWTFIGVRNIFATDLSLSSDEDVRMTVPYLPGKTSTLAVNKRDNLTCEVVLENFGASETTETLTIGVYRITPYYNSPYNGYKSTTMTSTPTATPAPTAVPTAAPTAEPAPTPAPGGVYRAYPYMTPVLTKNREITLASGNNTTEVFEFVVPYDVPKGLYILRAWTHDNGVQTPNDIVDWWSQLGPYETSGQFRIGYGEVEITDIEAKPGIVDAKDFVNIRITVKNIGDAKITDTLFDEQYYPLIVNISSNITTTCHAKEIGVLYPGQNRTISFIFFNTEEYGRYDVNATVDASSYGLAGFEYIWGGWNDILETSVSGDDIVYGWIYPGDNGELDSVPAGDDYIDWDWWEDEYFINPGVNNILETQVSGDDVIYGVILPGENGVIDSVPGGDDELEMEIVPASVDTRSTDSTYFYVASFDVEVSNATVITGTATDLTVNVSSVFDGAPIDGAEVILKGAGVNMTNTTDSSGMAIFTDTNATKSGKINAIAKKGEERGIARIQAITVTEFDPADTNKNRVVSMVELMVAIGKWKAGAYLMGDLMTSIARWKAGSY